LGGVDTSLDGGLILGNLNGTGVCTIDGDAEFIATAQFAVVDRQAQQEVGADSREGGGRINRTDVAEGDRPRPTDYAPGSCQRPGRIGQPIVEHGTIKENTVSQGDRLIV
jgi:hypothetical protein